MCAAACVLYGKLELNWVWFAAAFLAPDLFMVGYALGPRWGAHIYNLGHTYLAPLVLAVGCVGIDSPLLRGAALVWAAHIGFDRALGYGLKYETHFKHTHLQRS